MSKHGDGGDDGGDVIAAVVIAVIGLIIGAVFAAWMNKKNTVRLPETLEPVEPLPPSSLPPVLPWHTRYADLLMVAGATATGSLLLSGTAFFSAASSTSIGTNQERLTSVAISLGSFMLAAIVGFYSVKAVQVYRKAPKRQPPPQPQPKPINFTQVRLYTVTLPRSSDWEPEQAYRFMEQILHKLGRLTFQIVAEKGQIAWRIVDLRAGVEPSVILQAIGASYPEADVKVEPFQAEEFTTPFHRYVLRFKQATDFVQPIRYVTDLKPLDPLVAITQEMNALREGERVIYTLCVSTFADFAYKEGEKLVTRPAIHPLQFVSMQGWADATVKAVSRQDRVEKYQAPDQKVLREKLNNLLFQGLFFIQVDAPTQERVAELALFDSHIWQFVNQPYNALIWQPEPWPESIIAVDTQATAFATSSLGLLNTWITNTDLRWKETRLILEPRELASLWHLPHEGFSAPHIAWQHGRRVQIPSQVAANRQGICLGINRFAGCDEPVYMLDSDRANHINIVGKTGTGKSTLLHHLIHQDIERGNGVAVIDPHGTLVRDILQFSIPASREDDVVVLDLANDAFPPPLNPLGGAAGRAEIGRIVGVLTKIYGDWERAPRMANALTSALVTLRAEPQATVRDVVKLFLNVEYRKQVLERVTDDAALEFWEEEYENFSDSQQMQIRDPVVYRMRSFYENPDLYPVICHPDALDFGELIHKRRIILVALGMDERRIPEREQNLIGALVISQLQMAAMNPSAHQTSFSVYIDEVQNFVTTSLKDLFSEARKYGVSLVVANQYLSQLAGPTLDAMLGNVGATIAFRCGLEDARALAPYTKPGFTAEDLVDLDMYQAAVKMQYGGQTQPAFSLMTHEPLPNPNKALEAVAREGRIRQRSIDHSSPKSRAEVLAWLAQRYPRRVKGSGSQEVSFYDRR